MLIRSRHEGYSPDGRRVYPGGGKGSDAPPPDPRLIDANIRSLDKQGIAIDRVLANADKFMPLQMASMQFGLDAAKTAYGQSQEDRTWMLGRRSALGGAQDQLLRDAADFNSDERQQEMANLAAADVSQAFGLARGQQNRQLSAFGLNPNKGAFAGFNSNMNIQEALAKAGAINKTRQAARLEGFALTDRAVNALAGYPAMGMAATGAGAGFGGMGLTLTNSGLAGMNSGYGLAGSMAGSMGGNAAGMYSAMGNYKSSQDQIAAQSNPWSTILGAATGVGSAWGINKAFG